MAGCNDHPAVTIIPLMTSLKSQFAADCCSSFCSFLLLFFLPAGCKSVSLQSTTESLQDSSTTIVVYIGLGLHKSRKFLLEQKTYNSVRPWVSPCVLRPCATAVFYLKVLKVCGTLREEVHLKQIFGPFPSLWPNLSARFPLKWGLSPVQSANERTEAPLCPKRDRFQRSDDTKGASDQYVGSTIDEGASFFLLDVFSFPCFRPYLHLMVSPRAFRHSLDQY